MEIILQAEYDNGSDELAMADEESRHHHHHHHHHHPSHLTRSHLHQDEPVPIAQRFTDKRSNDEKQPPSEAT